MKKTIYLIFLLYFAIFIIGGFFIYNKYLNNPVLFNNKTLEVERVTSLANIYFSKATTLYQFNANLKQTPKEISDAKKLVAEGDIGHMEIDNERSKAYFEVKNNSGNWEIWDASLSTLIPELYIGSFDENLNGFSDFQRPKISPDGDFIAFIGLSTEKDVIFLKNISDNTIKKIAVNLQAKIVDFSWSQQSTEIVYCTSNLTNNSCFVEAIFLSDEITSFDLNVKNISCENTENIIYLSNSEISHLFSINKVGQENTQIDDVAEPNKIIDFSINNNGQKIAYEVIGNEKSNIYFSNIDGSNRIQLTTDGKSVQPIFSSDGENIAYVKQNEGIYINHFGNLKETKILNLNDSIDSLLVWR